MDKTARRELGVRLARRREAMGCSQAQIAGEAGCSHATVHRVETGTYRGGEATIRAIGAALGLDERGLELELEDVRYRLVVHATLVEVAQRNPGLAASIVTIIGDMVIDGDEHRALIRALLEIRRGRRTA